MGNRECRLRGALALAMFLGLVISSGCGEDESGGPPTVVVTPGWSVLFPGQAADPAYGPSGTPAAARLAYASFRAPARADSTIAHGHLWIHDPADSLNPHRQVTAGEYDDYDPVWSPDGSRLAFTRDNGARRDVYWVDVTDAANPGTPVQITDRSLALTGASDPGWVTVGGEQQITFSDGRDLWRIRVTGGSPSKLVPDPSDFRPSDCGGTNFEDLDAVTQPGATPPATGTHLAVVSRGRVPVGSIHVISRDGGGAPLTARIWLSPCDTLAVNGTEATFSDLPLGVYHVRGYLPGGGRCDTLDVAATLTADAATASDTLVFQPTGGTLLVRAISVNASDFFYFIDCQPTPVLSHPVSPASLLDSLIFSPIECVAPGLHMIGATQGERIDTAWVNVVAGETLPVTLQFLDSTSVDTLLEDTSMRGIYPRGGEGSFYRRACLGDSVAIGYDPVLGDSIYDCTDGQEPPHSLPWSSYWAVLDTLCAPGAGDGARGLARGAFPVLPHVESENIWLYDQSTGIFSREVSAGQAQNPVWDPRPGANRIAYVTRDGDHWAIAILNLDSGQEISIALPGRTGPFVCVRDAVSLSWSPDGTSLAVALGPCGGGSYPFDLQIWTADLSTLGVP